MQEGWKVWLHCSYSTIYDRFMSSRQIEQSFSTRAIFSSKMLSIYRYVKPTFSSGCLWLHGEEGTLGLRTGRLGGRWILAWGQFRFGWWWQFVVHVSWGRRRCRFWSWVGGRVREGTSELVELDYLFGNGVELQELSHHVVEGLVLVHDVHVANKLDYWVGVIDHALDLVSRLDLLHLSHVINWFISK